MKSPGFKRSARILDWLLAAVFGCMIAVGLGAQSGFAMICAGGETSAKTNAALITNPRVTYALPVVLRGAVDLFGAKVGQVVAYRWTERQWQEAPIQIDEVNAQGDYVLENGLPFTAGTGDGLYNGNDELSFDGLHLGDDFEFNLVPGDLMPVAGRAWRLRICTGSSFHGSLLIVSGKASGNQLTTSSATRFSEKPGTVETSFYRYEFNRANPALLGQVWLRDAKGTEHQVFASSAFAMPLKLPWWLPDFTLDDSGLRSEIECWRVGPVRTIVAVGVKLKSFLSIFNLHMFSELVFYRNRFQIPTVIQFTFDPATYLKPGSGLYYALTFPPDRAWPLETNLADLPAMPADELVRAKAGTGGDSRAVGKIDLDTPFWARGRRPEGAFEVRVRVDKAARRMVPPPMLVRPESLANPNFRKSWPPLAAKGGDLGVYLDISGVRSGVYDFGLDLVLYREADEGLGNAGSVDSRWDQVDIKAGPPAQ